MPAPLSAPPFTTPATKPFSASQTSRHEPAQPPVGGGLLGRRLGVPFPNGPGPRLARCAALLWWAAAMLGAPTELGAQSEASAPARRIEVVFQADASHHVEVDSGQDTVTVTTTGNDPYVVFELPALPQTTRDWVLQWEYFCPAGVSSMQWRTGPRFVPESVALPAMEPAEGWTPYTINLNAVAPEAIGRAAPVPIRIDLGKRAGIRLQWRRWQVRPINQRELADQRAAEQRRQQKIELAAQIDRYRARDWPASITAAQLDEPTLEFRGRSNGTLQDVFLIARHPTSVAATPPTEQELEQRWPLVLRRDGQHFEASIPLRSQGFRYFPGHRFQLVRFAAPTSTDAAESARPVSSAVYPQPRPRRAPEPPPALRAAKGLTCIDTRWSADQLKELGVEHASVNVVLSGLVSPSRKPGWSKQSRLGQTWWVNEPRLRRLDANVRVIRDAGAVAAAILLIPNPAPDTALLAHPQADPAGIYAMPHLADRSALAAYAATLDVLADRYGGTSPAHGRIDHWIVHNEIDYGWQWTNMGEQPMEVFLDHYVRSMRLVDHAVRSYNPHGRVFVSLTHRWNTTDNRHWKTYAPKRILQWLIRESQLAGDFPWGVAYHPYPQSLWKADFWNDTRATDDLQTELITIKNLRVLDRFMKQPASRMHDGTLRPVLCSEQGFHADAEDEQQLAVQSAALLKTWQILRQCSSILAFDYHRPSDHPNEGGLRLGLRGLPTAGNPLGHPKPAWEVFRTIGTEGEAAFRRKYRSQWQSAAGN